MNTYPFVRSGISREKFGRIGIGVVCLLWISLQAFAVNVDITAPSENTIVSPGDWVLVTIHAYNSVAGLKSIGCQGEGDIYQEVTYGPSPPTLNISESFYYVVPNNVVGGQTLTITATVEDWVDGLFYAYRHVVVSGSVPTPTATPTPTPSPTPASAWESIDIDPSVKDAVVDPSRNRLYLTNNANDRVDIVDLGTHQLDGSIPVGTGPYGADITSDTSHLYVCNHGDNTISVIDLDSQSVADTIDLTSLITGSGDFLRWIAVGHSFATFTVDDGSWGYLGKLNLSTRAAVQVTGIGLSDLYKPVVRASQNDRYIYATESSITTSDMYLYDALLDHVDVTTQISNDVQDIAVNYDASYIAFSSYLNITTVLDRNLQQVSWSPQERAIAFMPTNWKALAGFASDSSFNYYNSLSFYDVDAQQETDSKAGLPYSYTITPMTFSSVIDPRGQMLYVHGAGKLYFIPVDYALSANPLVWPRYK